MWGGLSLEPPDRVLAQRPRVARVNQFDGPPGCHLLESESERESESESARESESE